MIYVVGWLFCGLVTAIIGSRKGEGCAGFFFGILLGPFGILFAIYSRGNREECPFCREVIHNEAVKCPHCQNPITRAISDKKSKFSLAVENSTGFSLTQVILMILSILIIFLIYLGSSDSSKNNVETKAVTSNNTDVVEDSVSDSPVETTNQSSSEKLADNEQSEGELKNLIAEKEALVRDCHSRSDGGSPETTKICARMEVAFDKLIKSGLCYGENSEIMADKRWGKCKVAQNSSLVNDSKVTNDPVATDQELLVIKPYIYAAETLNRTCDSAINGTIEKVQVCSQRDGAMQTLKNYGWCWKQDTDTESNKDWVKCNIEQKSSQGQNSVELQNNSVPAPQVVSLDDKKEKSTSEVLTNNETELSKNQDAQHHYYVQIGVFSADANVELLQNKLSDLGYKSQTEIIDTAIGKKTLLRTQEFSDRNEAGIALNDIKDAGLSGMVVSQ